MYIDKIDDFVDKLLDDYFSNKFKNDKFIDSLTKEKNFIKYQKEINDLVIDYLKTVSLSKLKDTLINQENEKYFEDIIKKYLISYIFLFISKSYNDTIDTYSNNIVEFSKNQNSFKLKINNFFNPETNANIIELFKLVKNIYTIFEVYEDSNKINLLIKRPDFKPAFVFLNTLGEDIVTNVLMKGKDENLKLHNLIKLIIIINFYQKNDKKDLSKILENTSVEGEEYTYIDIVVPTRDNIDYVTIESLLTRKEILSGYTATFWNYIIENQDNLSRINLLEESVENKILHLINSGILVPVLEDFLLYHKDSERYDKNEDINTLKDLKKREETKIKYIVTKIDTTADFYSKNTKDGKYKDSIKKNFYTPMNNRKAILVNNNEEMKILTKLVNQGSKVIESNEYFNELANYRVYPYINFKDFKDAGFAIQLNKTVPAVRSVSLEKTGDFRQAKYHPLQLRVGSKNEYVNIVGFIVPTNQNVLECLKVKDLKNIHNYGNNGYDLTLSYLSEGTIKNTPHKSSIFWLFDMKKDFVRNNNTEESTVLSEQDLIKNFISKFYDDILVKIYDEFSRRLDEHKDVSLQKAKKILESIEKRTVKINRNLELYNNIEDKIINKSIKKEEKYDEKEDLFYGIEKTSKELPKYSKKKDTDKIIRLDVSKSKDENVLAEIEEVEGICQHLISWENINKLKRENPLKYQEKIYEFIQEYVIENNSSDFVCKSCSTQIDVKKYVEDGTYDDDTNRFVTFSMPFDTPLEELSEYEKYKVAIRSLDKVIEKIAMICNIPAYIGNLFNIRIKRKNITKDLLDVVIDNNYFLKKNIKERSEHITKNFGISRELSNLFVFELENNIFVFSSKEKDYYKSIKYNNILAYLIILMCLDINDSQLSFMTGDKKGLCNIHVFDKYGHVLFDNLRIIKNRNGDTEPIKNNIVLCYIIYLISCMMTKYSMWYYDKDDKTSKKFNPTIQKIIVHTTVDILNSILQNSENNKAGMIFEILSTKFYLRLNTFFNDTSLYKRLKGEDESSIASDRKTFVLPKTLVHKIEQYYPQTDFELPPFSKVVNKKFRPQNRRVDYKLEKVINYMTNCEDGKFHKWASQGKDIACDFCKKTIAQLEKENSKNDKEIQEKNKYMSLQKLASKYCVSGSMHKFSKNKKGEIVCKACHKIKNEAYSEKELDTLNTNLFKNRFKVIKLNDLSKEKTPKIVEKLEENYNKVIGNKNLNSFIDDFIKKIESNIGEIENKDIYLRDNIYVINHDYDGGKIDKPIILTDKDNRINFKAKHPFYKTDVLTYSFNKSTTNKIEVFYDAISKVLLGYKETSKDYVQNLKTENRLKINYSLTYKLKYLGIESNFIDIYNRINKSIGIENYTNLSDNDKESFIEELIFDISRERIKNLKKVIYEVQRIINQIKNHYSTRMEEKKVIIVNKFKNEDEEETQEEQVVDDSTHFEKVLEKFSKKITELITSDENNEYTIFENWNLLSENITTKMNIKDYRFNTNIDQTSKIMEADEVIKFDNNGNMLLYYIISELSKLLDFNKNKYIKNNITVLIIEIVNYLFNIFNLESIQSNISVKRLEYILSGLVFAEDLENVLTEFGMDDELDETIENPTEDDIEQKEDAREEDEALDIDGEFDYESNLENITG